MTTKKKILIGLAIAFVVLIILYFVLRKPKAAGVEEKTTTANPPAGNGSTADTSATGGVTCIKLGYTGNAPGFDKGADSSYWGLVKHLREDNIDVAPGGTINVEGPTGPIGDQVLAFFKAYDLQPQGYLCSNILKLKIKEWMAANPTLIHPDLVTKGQCKTFKK